MEWWNTFFNSEFYGKTLDLMPEERTDREVDFVLSALQLKPKARVLDLCCGTGRHAIKIARCGFRVTGQDLSAKNLKTASENAAKDGLKIDFVRSDMRKIPFSGHFDAVINLFGSFGYFSEDRENFKVLGAVARALKPGGLFFLESRNRDNIVRDESNTMWFENDEGITINDYWFDAKTDTAHGHWIWIKDGLRTEGDSAVKMYPYTTMKRELEKRGLEIVDSFGDYDGVEFSHESPRIILIARKKKPSAR